MTNEELAKALEAATAHNYILGVGDKHRLREAAQRLREMPKGGRIEAKIGDRKITIILHERSE